MECFTNPRSKNFTSCVLPSWPRPGNNLKRVRRPDVRILTRAPQLMHNVPNRKVVRNLDVNPVADVRPVVQVGDMGDEAPSAAQQARAPNLIDPPPGEAPYSTMAIPTPREA